MADGLKLKDDLTGQVFENNRGRAYQVTSLDPVRRSKQKMYHIKFLESGYETLAARPDVRKGLIRDRLEPTMYGKACLGFASYYDDSKLYQRWHAIISRCYNPSHSSYPSYGAAGITVCERWLRFDFFLQDIPHVEGYQKELVDSSLLHLDKDIKQQHLPKSERVYSLETCMFVSKKDNDSYRVQNESLRHSFTAISADGTVHQVNGIRPFAKENNLNHSMVALRLKQNTRVPYKGWIFIA